MYCLIYIFFQILLLTFKFSKTKSEFLSILKKSVGFRYPPSMGLMWKIRLFGQLFFLASIHVQKLPLKVWAKNHGRPVILGLVFRGTLKKCRKWHILLNLATRGCHWVKFKFRHASILGEGHLGQRWRIWDPMGTHNNFFTHWNQVITIKWQLDIRTPPEFFSKKNNVNFFMVGNNCYGKRMPKGS